MWLLADARALVSELQLATRHYGYHLALGGGVLNKGQSDKDLDLYFLPLDDMKEPRNTEGLLCFLEDHLGYSEPIFDPQYERLSPSAYRKKVKFDYNGKRIDAFIV